jgi:outer membrane protein OmpA-like peptidoglycan-associated protein
MKQTFLATAAAAALLLPAGGAAAQGLDFSALSEACQAAIIAAGADPAVLSEADLVTGEDGTCGIVTAEPDGPATEETAMEETAVEEAAEEVAEEPLSEATAEPDQADAMEAAPEPEAEPEAEAAVVPEAEPVAEAAPETEAAPEEAMDPAAATASEETPGEAPVTEPAEPETTEETTVTGTVQSPEETPDAAEDLPGDAPEIEPVSEPVTEDVPVEDSLPADEGFSFLTLSEACQATIIADGTLDIPSLSPDQLVIAEDGSCTIVPLEPDLAEATAEEAPAEPPAAAEVPDDPDAEATAAVDVETETVTDDTSRSSDEEVAESGRVRERGSNDARELARILGAVGVGVVIGTLLDNDDEVVADTGDRIVVERDGRYYVRTDENELLRRPGSDIRTEEFADGSTRTIVTRDDGIRIVTIRDRYGYVVRRVRYLPDGSEFVLFDDTGLDSRPITSRDLPPVVEGPEYADLSDSDEAALLRALEAAELRDLGRSYSLRQIRENEMLRSTLPRIDLDVITFDSGSAALSPDQARNLTALGRVMARMIRDNPGEVFLIEGHTDAVGSEISNLALSDRRAETVALALTEYFGVPPENLVVQGYGEEFLKVPTLGDERANRRAAVRRITSLLGT